MAALPSNLLNINQWLTTKNFGSIVSATPLSGGCINSLLKINTDKNHIFCLKQNNQVDSNFFKAEALGLKHLALSNTISVPEIICVEKNFLLLEFVAPGPKTKAFWEELGIQLARCHMQVKANFGFECDNFCGLTPQINTQTKDGFQFFAEQRLLIQSKWARDKDLLSSDQCRAIESIASKLSDWIPWQSPALIHGDLWSGNIHCSQTQQPYLIDPACYWGWPEADLAMTILFGGFNDDFYSAYETENLNVYGWRNRAPLYNLYHLLNHLNIFGGSYLGEVISTIKKYA